MSSEIRTLPLNSSSVLNNQTIGTYFQFEIIWDKSGYQMCNWELLAYKTVPAFTPKNMGREGIRSVCDIEIREMLCV